MNTGRAMASIETVRRLMGVSVTRPRGSTLPAFGGGSPHMSLAYRAAALVFLAYPIAFLVLHPLGAVETVLVLLGTALFAGLLVVASRRGVDSWRSSEVGAALVLALLAVATALVVLTPGLGFYPFYFFAAAGASTLTPPRRAVALMLLAGVAAGLAVRWGTGDLPSAIVQGTAVTMIGATIYLTAQARRTNRELVEARHELARLAVADERSRIARDLHDTLGQSLSVIALKSELASRLLADEPDRARTEMLDIQHVARDALASVRGTVGGYRQPTLSTELAQARKALAAANIHAQVSAPDEALPAGIDAVLAWAVREGVTNIVRHSRARHAHVAIKRSSEWVEATISDDGPGAGGGAPGSGATAGKAEGGFGLIGLSERVGALGGRFTAGPVAAGGFQLTVSLPLDAAES